MCSEILLHVERCREVDGRVDREPSCHRADPVSLAAIHTMATRLAVM